MTGYTTLTHNNKNKLPFLHSSAMFYCERVLMASPDWALISC